MKRLGFFLAIGLVVASLFRSNTDTVSTCFVLPRNNGECMFSLENVFGFDKDYVSRFEDGISFGKGGSDWRLSGFNDLKFDIYNEVNGGNDWMLWDSMRKERKYPFKALFTVNKDILERISETIGVDKLNFRIAYSGVLNDGDFTTDEKVVEIEAYPDEDFKINYQNYECVEGVGDCLEDVSRVKSISHNEATLMVSVLNIDGVYVPIESMFSNTWNIWVLNIGVFILIFLLLLVIMKRGPLLIAIASKYRLIDLGYFVFYSLSIFVFIKLFAKVYLKYYPHSFVAEYLPFIKYALLLVVFLFSFEYLWNNIVGLYKTIGNKLILGLFALAIFALFALSLVNGFSFSPRSIYYEAGFDQLTYYSWSRDILREKTFFVEPTVVYSKPLFLYFKALGMMIFGDANSNLDTCLHWVLLSLPVMLVFTSLLSIGKRVNKIKVSLLRLIVVEIVLAVGVYWYFVMNGWFVRFIENISEMPAWFFMGVATCFALLIKVKKQRLLLVTVFASLSLLMRTTMVIYLPILLAGIYVVYGESLSLYLKRVIPIGLSLAFTGLLIMIHSRLGSITSSGINKYFSDNTSVSTGIWSIVERWPKLLPSNYELLIWVVLISSFIINILITRKWWRGVVTVVIIVATLIMQLPMLSQIYGNRGIFWLYWMLSYLSVVLILDVVKSNKVDSDS